MQLMALPSVAAAQSRVSLTFDGGSVSQYNLGYLQGLQPHGGTATFFVNSGTVATSGNFMTWAQLGNLVAGGNDIGGKSVNATNLTTDPNPTAQVCNDRAALLQHGLTPVGFAYPGGASNATVQGIVKSCGYGNARTAGSLSPTGPTYAETLPPPNWFATRAYAPGARILLANMQALVNGAATHGGGWSQIVIGKVCSQSLDPNNYSTCTASSGWIELADLNAFLDWMSIAGQSGGAPTGAALSTVRAAVASADAGAPTTTITCNGAACQSTPYTGVVSVTLAATDTGSGVSSTHYTVDGSDPTLASPTYVGTFNVNNSSASTTVKFRSWDYAGNVEATNTQVILAPADNTPPTTTITCNGSACSTSPYVETVTATLSATDGGGSGVASTYYTTDGSTPTTASTVYTAPFTLATPATYNVQFFSTDGAGNAELVKSQQIKVDPVKTKVSLTFDSGAVSQYTLGYLQALKPHGATATYFVNSGTVSVGTNIMTWAQLQALAGAGADIGGKSVSSANLTTDPNATAQVCDDRTALTQHGLTPVAFAYPGGASNATVKAIVKSCGYGSGRSAGSLSPTGPTYAETLPPADWYATRAYAPAGRVTLANMQALVSGAASHHGGWSQIVIGRVCSQAQDPNNYTACTATAGWVDLADLNSFLDWMSNAGQTGGAPAGAALNTVRDTAISADTAAPVTTIACNGSTCASSGYPSTVYVTLASTDVGSAVASTHYTTDGSDPTQSSPTYTGQLPVTRTQTVKFRAWDNTGNAEAVNTQVVQVDQSADSTPPTTAITCNGATCAAAPYTGVVTVALAATDNPGGWGVDKTYYTIDGSVPTASSTAYSGPFTLNTSATVMFFSTDLAGNGEQPQAQQLQVSPYKTVVSMTFDDQYENFWLYLRPLLRAHNMNATIYTITGDSEGPFPCCMSWSQLRTMQNEGDDIGGHGRNHLNLTDPNTTYDQKVQDVCGGRQDLMDNGISDPASYAYPFGAFNATAETIVQSCGYQSARQGGGLASTTTTPGPRYAETLPPQDPYAVRAIDVDASAAKKLSDLENFVTAAASHNGGWLPITFHEVCNSAAPDYSACMSTWSAIDDTVMAGFLDWLANAGQAGGAPAGVSVQTMRAATNTPDSAAPSTIAKCDGSPCLGSAYGGSLRVSLSASDPGGVGVRKTFYTTDGTTPTQSSRVYSEPILLLSSTTVKFFSVDNGGNVEGVQTAQIQVGANPEPVIAAAGDIACDPTTPSFNGGNGSNTDCRAKGTSNLLVGADAVLPLGDEQYNCGGYNAFMQSYDPTWGRFNSLSHPVPGDKEYATSGGTDCSAVPAAGYFQYFGNAAGDPAKGYYSYNVGSWHVIALNTGPCDTSASFCAAGSAQDQWLQQDLAATTSSSCTLAYYQNPRFASTSSGGNSFAQPIWKDLYTGGADVVLNGDAHWYERFKPMDALGNPDPSHGVQQFIVGTGGAGLSTPASPLSTSLVLDNSSHGVIQMVLHDGSYSWKFLHDTDGTLTDTGTANCHAAPDLTAPTTTLACNGAPCTPNGYPAAVQVTLSATDNTGGSGVDKTYYTTDGSTPTTASTVYTGPLTVASTSTVKFFSTDLAGNAETVKSQLISTDGTAPTTTIACNSATCSTGWYPTSPVTVQLTATDTSGGSGVDKTYYTTDGSTPTTASTAYAVPFTIAGTTAVKFFSTDKTGNAEAVNSQLIQIDPTAPITTVTCNGAPCSPNGYPAAAQVSLAATDNTGGSGVDKTYYTTDGSTPTTASSVYTGPFSVASTSTVKFFSTDVAGNAESVKSQLIPIDGAAPTTAIGCNSAACSSGWYKTTPVTVQLTATENAGGTGVDKTYYTTDGSTPTTASTAYAVPFTIAGTTTVKFFSTDKTGNAEAVNSQLIQIDPTAPTTAITCNSAACAAGWFRTTPVTVQLTATDNTGGSGNPKTYYTTDGSTPTTGSTIYTVPFTVAGTSTVKFFSTDVAGNAESVKSQLIQIDPTAPTTAITCNAAACSTGWYKTTPVTVQLTAIDNTGGSGVSKIYYTTNGSTPTTSSTVYTGSFPVRTTATVKFFAVDLAGNAEAVKSQLVQIDPTGPTTAITCNAVACSTGWYKTTPVTVQLTATDNTGGIGLDKTYYTTNGSTPTTASTVYTGPFTISSTATVKFFSTDQLGNAETVKSQLIQIDGAAPTVSITQPTSGTSFLQGTKVTITATATDLGTNSGAPSGLTSVAFYADGALLATDTTSPYTTVWNTTKVAKGTHSLTAVATDNAGNATASAAITVTIT
jgi:peptidoglycan/xylan/chitin deacetylase (PgdA/CDA1 family)